MSNGNGLGNGSSPSPFEPVRDAFRFQVPPAALERLCDLAKVPAHYRPTFANSITGLFAQAHRWHRIAARSAEMDAVADELGRVARDARKLKQTIEKLTPQARTAFGLYALRLEKFSEADSHESVRNQIEDLVNSGASGQAGPKVAQLIWAAGRIESAAATETWPRQRKGMPPLWKTGSGPGRETPHAATFSHFVIELGKAIQACNSPLQFEPDNIDGGLTAFLEAAAPHLPNEFIPKEVLSPDQGGKAAGDSRLKKLTAFWQ
ncbi:MAG: hypothetical protein ACLPX9_02475 [Rhodomicrobium sp.]